ncbi:hypothetical protein EON73_02685 [bacterium]|nr:MAG: hypothetical protein EON73_02685 [bacterium]
MLRDVPISSITTNLTNEPQNKVPQKSIEVVNKFTEEHEQIVHHVEEIKSMRDEINWRVKVAYQGSVVFISAISITGGTLFSHDNDFLKSIQSDSEILTISGIVVLIAVSAWVGVQNANHLIEKRIELYMLDILKVVHHKTHNVYYSWLGFLYGSVFFNRKYKNFIAKSLNASIGFFIYFLPNLIAILVWGYLLKNGRIHDNLALFIAGTFFFVISMSSTFMFFFYVVKVNNEFTKFYKSTMQPYLTANGVIH